MRRLGWRVGCRLSELRRGLVRVEKSGVARHVMDMRMALVGLHLQAVEHQLGETPATSGS